MKKSVSDVKGFQLNQCLYKYGRLHQWRYWQYEPSEKCIDFWRLVFLFSALVRLTEFCVSIIAVMEPKPGMMFWAFIPIKEWALIPSTKVQGSLYVCICKKISYSSVSWPWWVLKDWFLFFTTTPAAVLLWWILRPAQSGLGLQRRQR